MRGALRKVADLLAIDHERYPWQGLGAEGLERVRKMLLEIGTSPATTNQALTAIRGVTRAALAPGGSLAEGPEEAATLHAMGRVRNLPAEPLGAPGRALSNAEFSALLAVCVWDATAFGARDAAMIFSLYSGGLSCQELVELEAGDFRLHPATLTVNTGPSERRVPLDDRAAEALADWSIVRGTQPGRLFVPLVANRSAPRMTERNVSQIVEKRSRQAGIGRVLARDLRHTAIADKFEAGSGYLNLRRMVGPLRVDTLARYDGRDHPSPLPFLPSIPLRG